MNQSQQHRATPEQWATHRAWAVSDNDSSCILELRERIEALEAAQLEQAESHRFCTDAITRRVEALEAVQRNQQLAMTELRAASAEVRPAGGLVERDPECVANWPDCYEGGYDPSCCRFPKSCSCEVRRPLPNPVAEAQPAGLVEEVRRARARARQVGLDEDRAAISVVAAWLKEQERRGLVDLPEALEEEANR
jgi:hypothetical protein